jgi:hypothetical protein
MSKSSRRTTKIEEGTPPPRRPVNPLYELLREGKVREFNQRVELGERVNLVSCDFRGIDLRGMDPTGIDFSGCYFRQADLRGVDFRKSILTGASFNGVRISGAYFPHELTAEELRLSLNYGTRMRYRVEQAPVILTAPEPSPSTSSGDRTIPGQSMPAHAAPAPESPARAAPVRAPSAPATATPVRSVPPAVRTSPPAVRHSPTRNGKGDK